MFEDLQDNRALEHKGDKRSGKGEKHLRKLYDRGNVSVMNCNAH